MRKSWMIRSTAMLLGGGALWMAYSQLGSAPATLNLIKLKDDIYVIHNEVAPGNTTALITSEGVLLVDDKFDVDHEGILEQLKKVTDKPIKYVVNTHHHADHTGGNAKMLAMNAVIVASEQARENMVDHNQPGLPNIAIERRAHIYLGGKNVELYYFGRAHTNGDIVVYFPADRILAAGDMFTYADDDKTPLPRGELIDYSGRGSAKEWPKTLEGALQLDFDTVVPGHGNVTTKQEMARFREGALAFRARMHEMIAQKKTHDEIAQIVQTEFHWSQLQMNNLNGAIAELR